MPFHSRNPTWSRPLDEVEYPRLTAPRSLSLDGFRSKFLDSNNKVTFVFGKANCGQKRDGPQLAPPLIVNTKYLSIIKDLGWDVEVEEVEQIVRPTPKGLGGHLHMPFTVAATNDRLREVVKGVHAHGRMSFMIGGDHVLGAGSIRGACERYPDLRVLWFDAHADINTPDCSPSGNMHGMPLALLLGLATNVAGFEDERFKCLSPDRLGYIGLRDVDAGEVEILKKHGIANVSFGMKELDEQGIIALARRILDKINPGLKYPLHISFDVDGMDPMDSPSTGTPVARGVRLSEALTLLKYLRKTGCLVSMDLVEVNPLLGTANETELTIANARQLISATLGVAGNPSQSKI